VIRAQDGPSPLVPYGQGRARGLGAAELGVHGDEMDRLVALGLPVVPGLTVPVSRAADLTDPAVARHAVDLVQELVGRGVGDAAHPMLLRLSVSAAVPATGLPPDVPALGLAPANAPALTELIGREADLYDAWSHVVRLVAEGPLGLSADDLDDAVAGLPGPKEQVAALLELCEQKGSQPFPVDPAEQLALAAAAVLARWASPRGKRARRTQSLPEDLGLALHVQALRIGPWEQSGYGTAVSRDQESGALEPSGVFYAGMRRSAPRPTDGGQPLSALPGGADLLAQALTTLEHNLQGVAQVGFELRDGKLSLLSASLLERPSAMASIRLAVDLASSGAISTAEAVRRVPPKAVQELLHAQIRLTGSETLLVNGLPASPGAARGLVALSSQRALELSAAGVPVVLLSSETTPGDVPALLAAEAVVTTSGGLASHAAVVARGAGRPAVCGAADLRIDLVQATASVGDVVVREGEVLTVDGRTGNVYVGEVDIRPADPPEELDRLLGWADEQRRMGVRTNADTVRETVAALRLGAEGIGLCRTEHQFLGERLPVVRRFLLAMDEAAHDEALHELTQAQREDFRDLLRAVGDRPVTVRLLDAPLHEFLPHDGAYEDEGQAARAMEMREVNPMLGVRGVRLALLNEDLYPAQAEALFAAWVDVVAEGIRPQLEVMVPLVSLPEELEVAIAQVHAAAALVKERTGVEVPYLVGSMVETPRAALLAGRLAEVAQFLSFGTNDLTQMTFGFSRDDVESRLLKSYIERGLLPASPFAEFDADGVGALVAIAVERARAVRPDIKLGVCGEHGGDATSIFRLEPLGLDYVSCSPQRVPIARLAAAQATLGGG
jgi:pyruvate,orthophosphate dikinase